VTSIASAQDSEIAGRSPGPARWGRCAWYTAPGLIELHHETLPLPRADEILVRSLYSGISRGTERLVMSGNVAQSEYDRMRCPMQAGDFPFPVKYGYCAVGRVDEGAPELKGRTIFVLHPHQDFFIAPAASAFAGRSPLPLAADFPRRSKRLWNVMLFFMLAPRQRDWRRGSPVQDLKVA